jgi:phospholipid/cholesterol/gamma-HCH transport system substrate-binding protein
VALAALLAATIALALVLALPGSAYTIHAQFQDGGQLVPGDLVEVGGRPVGTVSRLALTPNGLADAVLKIDDGSVTPLHRGTIATIRAVGLASIANRFVELSPGPASTDTIPDGGVLLPTSTRGIVDLDALLNALDAPTRARLQSIFASGATTLAPPAGAQFNGAFHYLEATFGQTAALGAELVRDQGALAHLIGAGAQVASTLASRRGNLEHGVTATAATLGQIASQRTALADSLARAPAVLGQGTTVLGHLRSTLQAIDPSVRDLRPVAPRLARVLTQVVPVSRHAIPAVSQVRALLPGAREALSRLPPLERTAVPAMESATAAVRAVLPLLAGARPYAPDLIAGLFNGFGGSTAGYYDANGHYSRIHLELGQGGATGPLAVLAGVSGPGLAGYRTGLLARCPGGAVEPAPDASNPWVPPDAGNLCRPQDNHP